MEKRITQTILFILMFNLSICKLCNADKGVFQPHVNPHEIFTTDIPASINVSAEIGDLPMNDVKVTLHKTNKIGEVLEPLCDMALDISRQLFSGQFIIRQYDNTELFIKIVAVYNSKEYFESSVLKVDIFEPLPEGITNEVLIITKELKKIFLIHLKTNRLSKARELTLKEAKNNPNITGASLNGRCLSILYKNRLKGIVFLDDPNGEPIK